MADLFWSGSSGGTLSQLVIQAFNQEADFALRDAPVWNQLVDTRATNQTSPGSSVVFTIHSDLQSEDTRTAPTAIAESTDVSAVAPVAPTRVTVTLNEYGNTTLSTQYLRTLNFTHEEAERAVIVGRDMVDSWDFLIKSVADTSTNGIIVSGSSDTYSQSTTTSAITTGFNLGRNTLSAAVQYLRGKRVMPNAGNYYTVVMHPHVAFDIMAQNAATAWVGPHTYGGDTEPMYNGSVGSLLGAEVISTTRITTNTDGLTSAKVYRSYALGKQALAEAVAINPHIVVGPVVDHLARFNPLGWYALGGQAIYRPQALVKLFSSSSLAAFT